LSLLLAQGFVAKTTPTTRLASKLVPGARVRLVEAKAREYAQLFSKEQLDALEVAPGAKSVTATHAKVIAGDGETVGCFKLCHLRPVRL
jgi:ethanolamine utilization microcompartment shell protein EutS